MAAAHATLTDIAAYNRAWQEGRKMTIEQAIFYTVEVSDRTESN
jgi:hypothetical protein